MADLQNSCICSSYLLFTLKLYRSIIPCLTGILNIILDITMSMCTSTSENKRSQEELASNYALQVALQTMKERCQQLQARLSTVEEENLQLKIEKQRQMRQENKLSTISTCDIDKLQEQIAQLSRQKSQLTHHIYMVATENKHLWTRLSLLTEANESLGTRLNKISSALSNHTNKSEQLLHEVNHGKIFFSLFVVAIETVFIGSEILLILLVDSNFVYLSFFMMY